MSATVGGEAVSFATLMLTNDDDYPTAEWYLGAKLILHPGKISEDGGSQKVVVQAEDERLGQAARQEFRL